MSQNTASSNNHSLVNLREILSASFFDIRYATPNNFTKAPIYHEEICLCAEPLAMTLKEAEKQILTQGIHFKIWDAYRPFRAQERLWEVCPDAQYISKPVRKDGRMFSGSKHSRGCSIDLTLCDPEGNDLPMPTEFDDFSEKAHLSWTDPDAKIRANRDTLQNLLTSLGLSPNPFEWWHFDHPDWESYPLLDAQI